MFVVKYSVTSSSITIVRHTFCKDSNESWLTGIDITYDAQFYVLTVFSLHTIYYKVMKCWVALYSNIKELNILIDQIW